MGSTRDNSDRGFDGDAGKEKKDEAEVYGTSDDSSAGDRIENGADAVDASLENDGHTVAEDQHDEESGVSDEEWEKRVLCDDGNCIGVIGPDGFCKECGKRYEGEEVWFGDDGGDETEDSDSEAPVSAGPGDEQPDDKQDDEPDDEQDEREDEGQDDAAEKTDLDLEWENRKLCSDGACIGVIGPDGLCKECGKPFEE